MNISIFVNYVNDTMINQQPSKNKSTCRAQLANETYSATFVFRYDWLSLNFATHDDHSGKRFL
jgi:hypothetical protein